MNDQQYRDHINSLATEAAKWNYTQVQKWTRVYWAFSIVSVLVPLCISISSILATHLGYNQTLVTTISGACLSAFAAIMAGIKPGQRLKNFEQAGDAFFALAEKSVISDKDKQYFNAAYCKLNDKYPSHIMSV